MGVIRPRLAFVGVEIIANLRFWPMILASDMLERHSRALTTRITAKFPKRTLSKKKSNWIGAQGQVKLAQRLQKHSFVVSSSPENPKPKTKNLFFHSQLPDLLNP